jgi:hypothetical protein
LENPEVSSNTLVVGELSLSPLKSLSSLNAFDLINKAGMLNMTRLVRNDKISVTKVPTFFTSESEATVIIFRIRSILEAQPLMSCKYDPETMELRVTGRQKVKGFILFRVYISKVTDQVRMVDFDRQTVR